MGKSIKEDFNLKFVVSDLQKIEALLREQGEAYIKLNKNTGKVEIHKVSDINSVKESLQRLTERLDFKQAAVLKAAEPLRTIEGMLTKEAVAEIVREEVSGQLSSFYAENEETFRDIVSDCLTDWTNDIKEAATSCCPKTVQKQDQGGGQHSRK